LNQYSLFISTARSAHHGCLATGRSVRRDPIRCRRESPCSTRNRPNCTAWERFCKAGKRKPIQLSVRCSGSAECDKNPVDEAKRLLGAKSRTEAVRVALRELAARKRFKALMKKNGEELSFAGLDE